MKIKFSTYKSTNIITKNPDQRKFLVIGGQPFYQSTGFNSEQGNTWLPFFGWEAIWDKTHLAKPIVDSKTKEALSRLKDKFNIKMDHFPIRFGSMNGLIISSILGDGLWLTPNGKKLKNHLISTHPELFKHIKFELIDSKESILDIDDTDKKDMAKDLNKYLATAHAKKCEFLSKANKLLISMGAKESILSESRTVEIDMDKLIEKKEKSEKPELNLMLNLHSMHEFNQKAQRILDRKNLFIESITSAIDHFLEKTTEEIQSCQGLDLCSFQKSIALEKLQTALKKIRESGCQNSQISPITNDGFFKVDILDEYNEFAKLIYQEAKDQIDTISKAKNQYSNQIINMDMLNICQKTLETVSGYKHQDTPKEDLKDNIINEIEVALTLKRVLLEDKQKKTKNLLEKVESELAINSGLSQIEFHKCVALGKIKDRLKSLINEKNEKIDFNPIEQIMFEPYRVIDEFNNMLILFQKQAKNLKEQVKLIDKKLTSSSDTCHQFNQSHINDLIECEDVADRFLKKLKKNPVKFNP